MYRVRYPNICPLYEKENKVIVRVRVRNHFIQTIYQQTIDKSGEMDIFLSVAKNYQKGETLMSTLTYANWPRSSNENNLSEIIRPTIRTILQ